MKQLNVGQIAEFARRQCDDPIVMSFVLCRIDSFDQTNPQLSIDAPIHDGRREKSFREEPLPANTPVFGDFLVLEYDSHSPSLLLWSFSGLPNLENFVCQYFFFPSTDLLLPIIHGQARDYCISFFNHKGDQKTYTFQTRHKLKRSKRVLHDVNAVKLNWL